MPKKTKDQIDIILCSSRSNDISRWVAYFDRKNNLFSLVKQFIYSEPIRVVYEQVDYRELFDRLKEQIDHPNIIWDYLKTIKSTETVVPRDYIRKNLPLEFYAIDASFEYTKIFLSLMYDDDASIVNKYKKKN